jgi:predicted dehydrogenase
MKQSAMLDSSDSAISRRDMLKTTGTAAAVTAAAAAIAPRAYAQDDNTVQLGLVGCGGRGTGAAQNALSAKYGPVKLVAMADVFESRLKSSYEGLNSQYADKMDVPEDRRIVSFDGYKQVMDMLRPGDIVILTTPCVFRAPMFAYAIERGLNVFMEKPLTADAPTSLRMFELAKKADEKKLKVGVGLMCRHCEARAEMNDRIHNGEIGDITLMRAYRMSGPTASSQTPSLKAYNEAHKSDLSELMYQIRNFHSFLWLSGGAVSDFLIHNIDECCWTKNDWPVQAKASGGRHYRGEMVDQNFDTYEIEYTFADGSKLYVNGREYNGAHKEFASYAHGTKGSAVISTSGHTPAKCRLYKGQMIDHADSLTWAFPQPEQNPYQLEWDHLLKAIREDTPYNEVERGVRASLVTSMGRMAAHTGQVITYEQMLEVDHEFAPGVEKLTFDSPAPLQADENGYYPVPAPGLVKNREY